jgi:hypothetical protein
MDPNPGGPKTCGSGSPPLLKRLIFEPTDIYKISKGTYLKLRTLALDLSRRRVRLSVKFSCSSRRIPDLSLHHSFLHTNVHLHKSSQIRSYKKSQRCRNRGFFKISQKYLLSLIRNENLV